MMPQADAPLIADIGAAERHLMLLDESAEKFIFQTFDDNKARKDKRLARVLYGSLDQHAGELQRLNQQGAGVFVCVNAMTGARRKIKELAHLRALWRELDQEGAPPLPIEPHLIIESSPGKTHDYLLIEPSEDVDLWSGITRRLIADYGSDPNVKDTTRVLRLAGFWHQKDPARPHQVRILHESMSQPYHLAAIAEVIPPLADTPKAPAVAAGDAASNTLAKARKLAWDAARRTHDNPQTGRHAEVYRLGCYLRRDGLPGSDAVLTLALSEFSAHMRPTDSAGNPADLNWDAERQTIADGWNAAEGSTRPDTSRPPLPPLESYYDETPPAPPDKPDLRVVGGTDHDPRPVIEIKNGELSHNTDDAESALLAEGEDIYQHGNRLVRVGAWEGAPTHVSRPTGAGVLIDISSEWMADIMTRRINWRRFDKRKNETVRADCPTKVAKTLLARVGEWRFPHLLGFCDSPTLTLDGRVVEKAGFDAESGLYLIHPPAIKPIGEPTKTEAQAACNTLYELISTFPFVERADQSAALAMLMTGILRRALPSAPICCISASTPGTGKSLLADVTSTLATDHKASAVAIGKDGEEMEKRMDSVLLKGDSFLLWDNVDRAVKSDVLCQVTTQQHKSVRVLGLSKITEAPTNVTMMMTGNNLTLIGDLTRRALMTRLDAGCERPERREFTRDAIAHVHKFRADGIHAVLTISKAYQVAGWPKLKSTPYGSFEDWDRMIRRPLIWAGWPDPLQPAEGLREQDHEFVGMSDLLAAWLAVFGDRPVTASELYERITEREPAFGAEKTAYRHPALTDAAQIVMGDLRKWSVKELGYRLRQWAERIIDSRRIVKAGKSNAGVRWRVEQV